MAVAERTRIGERDLESLLGLESSKIGFYAEVKQKIQELESINLDLRNKTNELQAVFDSIVDGVVIFDSDGRVQYRNHVCPRMFPGESLLGQPCQRLFHRETRLSSEACPVEAALRGENRHIAFTETKAGLTRHFEATATPIEDAYGRPSRALIFLRDVTERRVQELHLMQAEKMSSVGVLAAGVAHEINNPLTSVAGYAEALLRRLRERPDLAEDDGLVDFPGYLQVIVREAYRCKSIIESLVSFSRKSDGSFAAVHLGDLIREVLELVGHRARYDEVEIRHDLDPFAPFVRGDAAGLRQVILNLTLNAIQAIQGKGSVELSTRAEADRVIFRVRDSGCGIPAEVLDRIWDPFFTTKAVGQGLGLGLSVSYNIVQRHGGHIDVESRQGHGSLFSVFLPALREP